MGESSTDLTVLNPATGELVDLRAADTETLACMVDELADWRARVAAFGREAEDELLDRLDKRAEWTHRAGEFELKAPSPTAGTESYDAEELQATLRSAIDDATVSESAASAALRRQLTLCLEVGWDADPSELALRIERAVALHIGGHQVKVLSASGSLVPVLAGIGRLRKLGLGDVLDAARVDTPLVRRRVKVTRKGRS